MNFKKLDCTNLQTSLGQCNQTDLDCTVWPAPQVPSGFDPSLSNLTVSGSQYQAVQMQAMTVLCALLPKVTLYRYDSLTFPVTPYTGFGWRDDTRFITTNNLSMQAYSWGCSLPAFPGAGQSTCPDSTLRVEVSFWALDKVSLFRQESWKSLLETVKISFRWLACYSFLF